MLTTHENDIRVTQEAARWFMELQTEGATCYVDFARWLRRSPEHVEEFLAISGISHNLDGIDRQRRIDVQELLRDEGAEIIRLAREVAPPAGSRLRSRWAVGMAMASSLVTVFLLLQRTAPGADTYVTRTGEQRTFKLPDGSLIQLNTKSRAQVSFSREAREVHLLEGEGLFTVERDAARPFKVLTDTTTVQALGTQFNVYRSPTGMTTVSVVEGKVLLKPNADSGLKEVKELVVGEQARVRAGHIEKQVAPDVKNAIAWRERRLIFHDKPLSEVVTEFNRYNTMQIDAEGDAGHEPFSGVFAADRPESLILFLGKDPSLQIEQRGGRIVIRER